MNTSSELIQCIEAVTQMMGKSVDAQLDPRGFKEQVRTRVTRLFEEGLDQKLILDLLIARQHEKHDQLVLDEVNHDYLDLGDFNIIEKTVGLNEPTLENRQRWELKFKEQRALYLCPQCGYTGTSEFKDVSKTFGLPDYIACPLCSYFEYRRFFTRDWTPEEQAAFEKARTERREAQAAEHVAKTELEARQKKIRDKIRVDAVKAVRVLDELQWTLVGEPAEDYGWDESLAESQITCVSQLMIRPTFEGGLAVPWDEVVAFFKGNLRPSEDLEAMQADFNRVAKAFNMEMLTAMTGGDND